MVVQIQAVPAFIGQSDLPFMQNVAKFGQVPRDNPPFAGRAGVDIHMFELEHHLQLFAFLVRV
ncbi:hypothetical protein D3C71_1935750 [compost metagenome]